MTLIELLETCNDSMNVNIYNEDNELISWYDGRDSIDEAFNNNLVSWIYPVSENVLNVGIK